MRVKKCMPENRKQNLTVNLSPQTVQKAKVLAARRSTSISGLLAKQIEALVDADEAYESAHLNVGQKIAGIALTSASQGD